MTAHTRIRLSGWARYSVVPLCSTPDGDLLAMGVVYPRTAVRFRRLLRRPAGLGTPRADEGWAWSLLVVILLLAVPYAVGWVVIVVWLIGLAGGRGCDSTS